MPEDYYTTLGVHRNATSEEIHGAYRDLARKHHPDLNPDDLEAEGKFEEVQAAFEVLSDPEKRAKYNRTQRSFATTRSFSTDFREGGQNTEDAGRTVAEDEGLFPPMVKATIIWINVIAVSAFILGILHKLDSENFGSMVGGLFCCSMPPYVIAMLGIYFCYRQP